MRTGPARLIVLLTIIIAASPIALADWECSYTPEEGLTQDYVVNVSGMVQVGDADAIRLAAAVPVRLHVESIEEDPAQTSLRVVLGPAEVDLGANRLPWTLTHNGYTAVRDARGQLVDVPRRARPLAPRTGDFAALFHDVTMGLILPEEPVAVGETWSVPIEDEPFIFEPRTDEREDRKVEGELRCELKGLRDVAGVQVAEIGLELSLSSESTAGTTTLREDATLLIDAETGWIFRADGKLTMAATAPSGTRTVFENLRITIRRDSGDSEDTNPEDTEADESTTTQ